VTTETRSEALPDIPSVGEFLPGYEASNWFGEQLTSRARGTQSAFDERETQAKVLMPNSSSKTSNQSKRGATFTALTLVYSPLRELLARAPFAIG
jgi:hypothetical protein